MKGRAARILALSLLPLAMGCGHEDRSAWSGKLFSFRLRDPALREASGIACSSLREGWFWMHNDSGDRARLFAVDAHGRMGGEVRLQGVLALDWEDCALEPALRKAGRPHLWVGDIGNNLGLPILKALYRIVEPDPAGLAGKAFEIPKREIQVFRCRFPRGRRDCECLMVHPLTGRPYLVPALDGPSPGLFMWPGKIEPGTVRDDLVSRGFSPVGPVRVSEKPPPRPHASRGGAPGRQRHPGSRAAARSFGPVEAC